MYLPSILAGIGKSAGALYYAGGKVIKAASENPEETASVFDFIMFLIVAALIAGAAGGIGAFVAKSVLDVKQEDVGSTFWGVGILVLIVLVIGYFVV